MRVRRVTAFVLSALLCALSAQAAFSPGLTEFAGQYDAGEPLRVDLTAEISAWPDISDKTLGAYQAWLQDAELSLFLKKGEDREDGAARLSHQDQTILSLFTGTDARLADMHLIILGGAVTRYLGTQDNPPWQTLLGAGEPLPDLMESYKALRDLAALCFAHLRPCEKALNKSISIKNAGRGASQLVYALNNDDANALWAQASPELLPVFERMFTALPRDMAGRARQALLALSFTSGFEVKRFLTKEGADMGLQITGVMMINGITRRMTLFGGISNKGLYLSFKLPATKGADTLEAQLSLVFDEGVIRGDWRYRQTAGREKLDASGKVNLKNARDDGNENITGKLTAKIRQSGTTERSLNCELMPSLRITERGAEGTLALAVMEGKRLLQDVSLGFDLTPADMPALPAAQAELDLSGADKGQIEYATNQLRASLLPPLQEFLFSLPMDTRLLVLHNWGRVQRTGGQSVDPLDPLVSSGDNAFTVSDITDLEITKEENP